MLPVPKPGAQSFRSKAIQDIFIPLRSSGRVRHLRILMARRGKVLVELEPFLLAISNLFPQLDCAQVAPLQDVVQLAGQCLWRGMLDDIVAEVLVAEKLQHTASVKNNKWNSLDLHIKAGFQLQMTPMQHVHFLLLQWSRCVETFSWATCGLSQLRQASRL